MMLLWWVLTLTGVWGTGLFIPLGQWMVLWRVQKYNVTLRAAQLYTRDNLYCKKNMACNSVRLIMSL